MDVECPYCNAEFELCDWYEDIDNDNLIEDIECPNCEKEFDVEVEFEPIPNEQKIEIIKCEKCGKKDKDRNMFTKNRVFPFPNVKENVLCEQCFCNLYFESEVNK